MADSTINQISDWKIFPIDTLILRINNESYEFKNIAEGSGFKIETIARKDDKGGKRNIALLFEGAFYVIENCLESITPALEAICGNIAQTLTINLQALPGQPNGGRASIQIDVVNAALNNWSFGWAAETIDGNICLKISVRGIFSSDSLSCPIPLFERYW